MLQIAYVASCEDEDSVYYLSGSSDQEYSQAIIRIYIDGDKIHYEKLGQLGHSMENIVAENIDGNLYSFIGEIRSGTRTPSIHKIKLV